jgi:hypothetical protein
MPLRYKLRSEVSQGQIMQARFASFPFGVLDEQEAFVF